MEREHQQPSAETAEEAELKSTATHDSEMSSSSLLSVKQDFSCLNAELSENDNSIMSTVSECDKSVDDGDADDDDAVPESAGADIDVASSAVNKPVDVTELPEHNVHESLCERQRDPSDETLTHSASPVEPDKSPSSDNADGLQPTSSSDRHEDVITSVPLSEAKSKKVSVKRKSADYKSSTADKRRNSPSRVQKLRQHKMDTLPVQHVKTSSGFFLVHEVTQSGEICTFPHSVS